MQNEWISTKDRLPADDELVLCIATGKIGSIQLINAFQLAEYYEIDGFVLCEFPEADNCAISHWMPLPEPPKGE